MRIIKKYTSGDTELIIFELNGDVKTMPLKYFKRKYGKYKI